MIAHAHKKCRGSIALQMRGPNAEFRAAHCRWEWPTRLLRSVRLRARLQRTFSTSRCCANRRGHACPPGCDVLRQTRRALLDARLQVSLRAHQETASSTQNPAHNLRCEKEACNSMAVVCPATSSRACECSHTKRGKSRSDCAAGD